VFVLERDGCPACDLEYDVADEEQDDASDEKRGADVELGRVDPHRGVFP